jgi:hypothetical protein
VSGDAALPFAKGKSSICGLAMPYLNTSDDSPVQLCLGALADSTRRAGSTTMPRQLHSLHFGLLIELDRATHARCLHTLAMPSNTQASCVHTHSFVVWK